jgi:1-aminocyclopropane-1-carboxylate deaminase
LILHLDYHFGGYAKTNDELIKFIKTISSSTGILLDPVYTGKMLYAVNDLVLKDYFAPGSNILAIHTGGLLGILGMSEKFFK